MFSGKTEMLISYARRYTLSGKKIVLIKYNKDTRYSVDQITSHNRTSIEATYSTNQLLLLLKSEAIQAANAVLIDEIQFFPDAPEFCDALANSGKIVVAAGLNGNYLREEFPVISKLVPKAEEIIHLRAVCSMCGEDAQFTKRLSSSTEIEVIGGAESYQPRCRQCFDEPEEVPQQQRDHSYWPFARQCHS